MKSTRWWRLCCCPLSVCLQLLANLHSGSSCCGGSYPESFTQLPSFAENRLPSGMNSCSDTEKASNRQHSESRYMSVCTCMYVEHIGAGVVIPSPSPLFPPVTRTRPLLCSAGYLTTGIPRPSVPLVCMYNLPTGPQTTLPTRPFHHRFSSRTRHPRI